MMNATLCTIDWERLVRVLAALLTPTIAVVTTYIAYQQYQTNRRQHRLALFEKRMEVFNSTMDLIASVMRDARVELDQLVAMLRENGITNCCLARRLGNTSTRFTRKVWTYAREQPWPERKREKLN
jgi:hypothetical protein